MREKCGTHSIGRGVAKPPCKIPGSWKHKHYKRNEVKLLGHFFGGKEIAIKKTYIDIMGSTEVKLSNNLCYLFLCLVLSIVI